LNSERTCKQFSYVEIEGSDWLLFCHCFYSYLTLHARRTVIEDLGFDWRFGLKRFEIRFEIKTDDLFFFAKDLRFDMDI